MGYSVRPDHLTDPAGNRGQITSTFPGQAHFAGTGPTGKTCRDCDRWARGQHRTFGGFTGAPVPVTATCAKFIELAPRTKAPSVPGHAAACKHFVAWTQHKRGQSVT